MLAQSLRALHAWLAGESAGNSPFLQQKVHEGEGGGEGRRVFLSDLTSQSGVCSVLDPQWRITVYFMFAGSLGIWCWGKAGRDLQQQCALLLGVGNFWVVLTMNTGVCYGASVICRELGAVPWEDLGYCV